MAALNIKPSPEDVAELEDASEFEVWPENWAAVCVFIAMGGPQGAEFAPLNFWLETECVPREEWRNASEGIRTLMGETMRLVREKHRGV